MFAGIISRPDAIPPDGWIDPTGWLGDLTPFGSPDLAGHWSCGTALLIEAHRFNAPWSHHAAQVPWREGDLAVALWGRLDNRADLGHALGVTADRLATLSDAAVVAMAWRHWGEALPERLLGDFALAVVDTGARTLFLARDPLGVKPLYYWPSARGMLFATSVAALRNLKGMEPTPDSDWMARYMLRLSHSHGRTAYREILKLPGGHCLLIAGDGEPRVRRWHHWVDDAPAERKRDARWVEAYRACLADAVRCRVPSAYLLGSENSGGIDSAAVTALVAQNLDAPGERLHAFGFALGDREPASILGSSREAGVHHNHLITDTEAYDGLDGSQQLRDLRVLGYPEEHPAATGHTPFYRECQLHGIRTLFSGFGGDEVVSNAGSQVRWELLDQRLYRALWDILPGNAVARLLRLGKAMMIGRAVTGPQAGALRTVDARWRHEPLRQTVAERLDLRRDYVEAAFLSAPYRRVNAWILKGPLSHPYVPCRLESSTLLADSYGIDYRWPLWDVRLVQQYLSTPAIEKVGPRGMGRYLHRRAIDGLLPRHVVWNPSKDMGYDRVVRDRHETGIIRHAELARRHEADLHPALEDLVDRAHWRAQIEQAVRGGVSTDFGFTFRWSARAVRCLNHWLHGRPVG